MADKKRIARGLIAGAAMAIGLTLVTGGHVAASTSNDVFYWCAQGGVKYEPVSTPFVVPDPPDGYVWTLLVVKAGSDDVGHGPGNDAPIVNPVVGQSYSHSTGKRNSHVILCMEPAPTTTVPGSTTTTTVPDTTTTEPGVSTTTTTTTTEPGATTTTTEPGATTTAVDQAGPTSSVAQSSGDAGSTTDPVGSTLPATGPGDLSRNLTLIALLLIGVGAVMLRLRSRPAG